jgi:hypothetical protein
MPRPRAPPPWRSLLCRRAQGRRPYTSRQRRVLGVRRGDRRETPVKLHLMQPTFVIIVIVNTFVSFVEMGSLAQRRCILNLRQHHNLLHLRRLFCRWRGLGSAGGPAGNHRAGADQGPRGQRGTQIAGGPPEQSRRAMDTCRFTIDEARK